MERPSLELLESAYDELFRSTLDKLVDSAVDGWLFQGKQESEEGVPGRSMAWKLFLTPQPPLTTSLRPHPVPPLDSLRHSRQRYISLLKDKMRAPDGSYEDGFHVPGDSMFSSAAPRKPEDWNLNNPLSLDSSNPWHTYFAALEARNTIRQDVERTFPEAPYFRSLTVQNEITNILFLHVGEREHVGYRQGMHELLACVYRAVDFDSIERCPGQAKPELQELCDRTYVAADAYALFGAIMQRMETWYEWRPPIPDPVSPTSPLPHVPHFSANGELISSTSIQPQIDVLENGQLDLRPYVAPIVPICASLRDEKLRVVDPRLWGKLQEGGVEAQMYGIRWLRLLFTREFSVAESMVIWDGLFASVAKDLVSPSSSSSTSQCGFEFALWISVAMLIRIRNSLIPGDYTTQLTQLLRYPTPFSLGSSQTSNAPALLLRQAQLLMTSPTPGTGASLVMQNRNELGIPVEVPDPPSLSPTPRRRASAIAATAPATVSMAQGKSMHERSRLQDMITHRLMDANETLGIQRGFFNTISELKKNFPDLSHTFIRTPSWNGSVISLEDERTNATPATGSPVVPTSEVDERPPWEPRSRSEVEREVAELRVLIKTLGDAVGWAVDVLLLDEDETRKTKEGEKTLQQKKTEAIECMAYVRDILSRGGKGEIDEERLVSEEEYKRRRRKREEQERAAAATPDTEPPPPKAVLPPPRVAAPENVSHSLVKPRTMLSTRDSSRPIPSLTRTPVSHSQIHPTPSNTPPSVSSTFRVGQVPHPVSKPLTTTGHEPLKVAPPWSHTPSNFSGTFPHASETLPRPPPPSTRASPKKSSDLIPRLSPTYTTDTKPEPSLADPLGVLR